MIVRAMAVSELGRIAEIDRSEDITEEYKGRGGTLALVDVAVHASRGGESTVRELVDAWKPLLKAGGVLVGAFDGDRLVGFMIHDRCLAEGFDRLVALHVTTTHRHRGIGRALTEEAVRRARSAGAERLYVSATPTRRTVDFYRQQGFVPLATPNARMLALEPDDIHMELTL